MHPIKYPKNIYSGLLEENYKWLVTEAIHSANNALSGIQYALYFLEQSLGGKDDPNLVAIRKRSEDTADVLRALYAISNPLGDFQGTVSLKSSCKQVDVLLKHRLKCHEVQLDIRVADDLLFLKSRERLTCQLLYTYLWLRIGRLDRSGVIHLTGGQEGPITWLAANDEGPEAQPFCFRCYEQGENDSGSPHVRGMTREEFARSSIELLAGPLMIEGPGQASGGCFRFIVNPEISWSSGGNGD